MASNIPPELIRNVPLFHHLSMPEIEELLAVAEDREYKVDETIFHEAGQDRAIYVIVDGQVQIVLPAPAFEETPVAVLKEGSVFGESSFFHPAPHVATARCLTAVLALRLPRAPFDLLLRAGSLAAHKFAGNAAAILAERLQATDRWIEEILQQEQDAQVAERWRSFRARMAFDFKPSRWATGVAW